MLEDYIQGNVWLNGEKIFGKDDMEIVGLFINAEPYYLTAEKQSQAFSQWLSNARRGITD